VIFKISPGFMSGSVFTTSQLIIKVVPRLEDSIGQASGGSGIDIEKIKANFAQIQDFSKATADKVNSLEARIANLESWAGTASAGSQPQNQRQNPSAPATSLTSPTSYSFHVLVNGKDYGGIVWLRFSREKEFKCRGSIIPMIYSSAGKYTAEYSFDNKEWGKVDYEIVPNKQNQVVELGGE
jgi:hypothetical protein